MINNCYLFLFQSFKLSFICIVLYCARLRNDFNRSSTRIPQKKKVILLCLSVAYQHLRRNNRKHRTKRNNINFSFPRAASPLWRLFFSYTVSSRFLERRRGGICEAVIHSLWISSRVTRDGWKSHFSQIDLESSSNPTSYSTRESRKCVYIMTFFYEIRSADAFATFFCTLLFIRTI